MKERIKMLDKLTRPADLVEELEDGAVRCLACAHRCLVREGRRGICQVRFNRGGKLMVPWGYVAGLQADPVEKKPFYHFLPGSTALTFGMLGCNFHCDYCQNWLSSQAGRDPACDRVIDQIERISAEEIISYGMRMGAGVLASSYNEPVITSEWAAEIFKLANQAGMQSVMVSNGYATPETLDYLSPVMQGYKVDLKSMQEKNYRRLGGVLQNVLDSIIKAHELGMWVEVVTLLVPGFNDSNEELWEMARFIKEVSAGIPWHISAFHQDYRMLSTQRTPIDSLVRAAEIGCEAGLKYVYAGNLPGMVEEYETTFCHNCRTELIKRRGFHVIENLLTPEGTCPQCGTPAAGVWK